MAELFSYFSETFVKAAASLPQALSTSSRRPDFESAREMYTKRISVGLQNLLALNPLLPPQLHLFEGSIPGLPLVNNRRSSGASVDSGGFGGLGMFGGMPTGAATTSVSASECGSTTNLSPADVALRMAQGARKISAVVKAGKMAAVCEDSSAEVGERVAQTVEKGLSKQYVIE